MNVNSQVAYVIRDEETEKCRIRIPNESNDHTIRSARTIATSDKYMDMSGNMSTPERLAGDGEVDRDNAEENVYSAKSNSSTVSILFDTLSKFMGYEQPNSQESTEEPAARIEQINVLAAVVQDPGNSSEQQSENATESDDTRKEIISKIADVLMNGRRNVTDDLIEVIYPVAKNIEDKLYREAGSMEEHADHDTLSERVRAVLKKEMQPHGTEPMTEPETEEMRPSESETAATAQRTSGVPRQHPLASASADQSFQWPTTHTAQAESSTEPPPVNGGAPTQGATQIMRPGAKVRGRPPAQPKVYSFSEHNAERNQVMGEIIRHLQTRSSNCSQNWHTAAPYLCERLESALYRTAKSMDEYSDLSTVQERLGRFITLGGLKKPTQLKVVKDVEPTEEPVPAGPTSARKKSPKKASRTSSPVTVEKAPKRSPGRPPGRPAAAEQAKEPAKESGGKDLLYQQQQRILMLQHASRCELLEGACPYPHCWSMQQLWRHVRRCSQPKCSTPHCVSSRYVLSHYAKCTDPLCRMCAPAREQRGQEIRQGQQAPELRRGDSISSLDNTSSKKRKSEPGLMSKENVRNYTDDRDSAAALTKRRLSGASSVHSAASATSAQSTSSRRSVAPQTLSSVFIPIIERILREPYAYSCFGAPVDPVALKLPDYFDIVERPMDLGTVLQRLREERYKHVQAVVDDVTLTFDNAVRFNGAYSQVGGIAKRLQSRFNEMSRKPRMELSQVQQQPGQQRAFGPATTHAAHYGSTTASGGGTSTAKAFNIYDQPPAPAPVQSASAVTAPVQSDQQAGDEPRERQPSPTPSVASSGVSGVSAGGSGSGGDGGKVRHARVMSPAMMG